MPRVLNKDAVEAKSNAEKRAATDEGNTTTEPVKKMKVSIVHDRTIINGHVLPRNCVVELTYEDVVNHRRHGVPLDDVADDDRREVFDVSEPYVAKGENEDGEQA